MPFTGDFENYKIKNASVQFLNPDGTSEAGVKFGCMGTFEMTPTIEAVTKKCEGEVTKKRNRITEVPVTVTAHVVLAVVREIFGLHNKDLKPGVWAYGNNNSERPFIFTADVEDMLGEERKLIALPNASTNGGFAFTVDDSATEVALMSVSMLALADSFGEFYYEALESELEDTEIAADWHTGWSRALVATAVTP